MARPPRWTLAAAGLVLLGILVGLVSAVFLSGPEAEDNTVAQTSPRSEPTDKTEGSRPSEASAAPADTEPTPSAGGDSGTAETSTKEEATAASKEPETSERTATVPTLQPTPSPVWEAVDPPETPLRRSRSEADAAWAPRLRTGPARNEAMVLGTWIPKAPRVYKTATLRVQLLNTDGRAYAELRRSVPVVPGRQGLVIRVPVPPKKANRSNSVVASVVPSAPITDGVVLEPVGHAKAVSGTGGGAKVRLTVRNPARQPVDRLTLAVRALSTDGYPGGTWHGTVRQRIGPRNKRTLRVRLSPPEDSESARHRPDPVRYEVRGYGRPGEAPSGTPSS